MNNKDLILGFILGIFISILGSFLFVITFTHLDFFTGVQTMKAEGKLGKLITLGSILDLIVFSILLKMNKDSMARGVVLAVICIAIFTLFA